MMEEADYNKLDEVYSQRCMVSVMLAKLALRLGYKAGLGKDNAGSMVLYIDLPEGQISYHVVDHDHYLLEGLPTYEGNWDGTFNGRSPEFVKHLQP